MAQRERRRRRPEARRHGAVGLGTAALAPSLASRDGALPGGVQRRARGHCATGRSQCRRLRGLGARRGCGRLRPFGSTGQAAGDRAGRQPRDRFHIDPDGSAAGAGRRQAQVTPLADRSLRGRPLRRKAGRTCVDARREGGSGAGTRRPEQAFWVRVGHRDLVQATGGCRCQGRDSWEADTSSAT